MTALYQLSKTYLGALDFLTDPDNEIDNQTALDTIEGLDGEIDDKIINVAKMVTQLEHDAEGIKAIAKRQAERAKALEQKASWLKDYLKTNMQAIGHGKVETPELSVKLASTPTAVKIIDESLIPSEFWRQKFELSIDKTSIKNAGGCPGVVIESGVTVRIK
jgi:hypothetical protein